MFKEDFIHNVSICIEEMDTYNRGAYMNESNRKSYVTSAANRAVGYIRQYESILNRIPISTSSPSPPSPPRVIVQPVYRPPHPNETYTTPETIQAPSTLGNKARGIFRTATEAVTPWLWRQGGKSKTAKKRRTRHKQTRHKQTRRQ